MRVATAKGTGSGTTYNLAAMSVTAGDVILVAVAVYLATHTINAPTDGVNTYTLAVGPDEHVNTRVSVWVAVALTTASITIAANFADAADDSVAIAHAYSGRDTASPTAGSSITDGEATGTDAVAAGAFTPVTDNCDVFGFAAQLIETLSPGTGFTDGVDQAGALLNGHSEDIVQTTAVSVNMSFTPSGGGANWVAAGVALKPSSGGANDLSVRGLGEAVVGGSLF